MSYRFDTRSEEQFKKDIKESTQIERKLMEVYVAWLNSGGGHRPAGSYSFQDNGVDNSGEYIKDDKKVHTGADFILKTQGGRNKKVEIKFCRPEVSRFHLKVSQIKKYIENDVCIVNFMGIDSNQPRFCILTPAVMTKALRDNVPVKMWNKECIRFKNADMDWEYVTIPSE
jgi:hypothetical protein